VRTLLDTNVMCELDPCVSIKEISADGPHRTTVALILTVHPMYDPSYSIALQTPKISFITRKKNGTDGHAKLTYQLPTFVCHSLEILQELMDTRTSPPKKPNTARIICNLV